MDAGSTILGTIMLLLCVVPFSIMNYNKKRIKRNLLQLLKILAQQHNCQINQHEFCGDFIIGLDENENVVFFSKIDKININYQMVELRNFQCCKVIKHNRTVVLSNKRTDMLTEHIDLCFISAKKNNDEIKFELYDSEKNLQLGDEIQFADKWEKILNYRLKNMH